MPRTKDQILVRSVSVGSLPMAAARFPAAPRPKETSRYRKKTLGIRIFSMVGWRRNIWLREAMMVAHPSAMHTLQVALLAVISRDRHISKKAKSTWMIRLARRSLRSAHLAARSQKKN